MTLDLRHVKSDAAKSLYADKIKMKSREMTIIIVKYGFGRYKSADTMAQIVRKSVLRLYGTKQGAAWLF